jgi:hypothetical protein
LEEKEVDDVKTIMSCFDMVFNDNQEHPVIQKQESSSISSEEVKIILDYGTKNHALFGPFGATYKEFKDSYLKGHAKYNAKLKNGPGWIFNKDELAEMEEKLKEADISYTKVGKKGDVKDSKKVEKSAPKPKKDEKSKKKEESSSDSESSEEEKPAPKSKLTKQLSKLSLKEKSKKKEESSSSDSDSESSEEEKPAPKEKSKKEKVVEPKEKPAPKKVEIPPVVSKPDVPPKAALKVTKNSFGNLVNAETGAVFASLVSNGRKTNVAIGIQNTETEKSGIDSLLPLDKERVEICNQTGRKILDEEMFQTLSVEDQSKYKKLVYRKEDEDDDGEEDEEEEENEDDDE